MQKITFITGNVAKAEYLKNYFHIDVDHKKLDLQEIQSLDLVEVVTDKAKRAFEIVGSPVLVEDVSLTFTSLKKLPGPLIKWFFETLGNDGLCRLIDGSDDRSAVAAVEFAYCDGSGVQTFHGSVDGTISQHPKGKTNFGWDPIFTPQGYDKTWAEMSADEKHETSMRKPALEKLSAFFHTK